MSLIKKVYLEQLTAREQLMEDIDAIIDGFFNDTYEAQYPEERDDLIRILCDAVCKNWTIKTVQEPSTKPPQQGKMLYIIKVINGAQ